MAPLPPLFTCGPAAGRMRPAAFTLVELLVAMAVFVVVLVVLFQVTAAVGNIWKSSSGKISAFQNARSAFSALNDTIARATLNTYSDYVNVTGGVYTYRTVSNSGTFVPTQFYRASELHFICGPAAALVPGAAQATNPGDAALFQAPMGTTNQSGFAGMNRTLNSVAFYVQYGAPDSGLFPQWLGSWLKDHAGTDNYRFRLVEFVDPAESIQIYTSTARSSYDLGWLNFCKVSAPGATQPRARVLADDVLLLVLRPRLSPKDEETVATSVFGSAYNSTSQLGSILCPNYHYDSRAWQTGYPASDRVNAAAFPAKRDQLMCNQVPPIIDVAMVCADHQTLARFGQNPQTPPAQLQVAPGLFTDASQMEADLKTFAQQLSGAHVRFHILRSSVNVQGARWANK